MEMSRLRTGLPNPFRETKFSGANADREISSFPVQLTTCRIGNLTRLIHTLAICVNIHTYMQYREMFVVGVISDGDKHQLSSHIITLLPVEATGPPVTCTYTLFSVTKTLLYFDVTEKAAAAWLVLDRPIGQRVNPWARTQLI